MRAVITFLSNECIRIYVYRVIRTGLCTCFARNTSAVIKIHDAVIACVECFGRTNFYAWSISAVVTAHYIKEPACVGKLAFFDVFYPCPIYADWNIVFRFTSHRASMATNTFAVINDKAVVHIVFRTLRVMMESLDSKQEYNSLVKEQTLRR